nr:uncharacterized protein LOC119716484 [Anas platyrhynchos]
MEARSAPILCNGRLMCPTLMHLQDDEIVKVWDAVSHFIRRQFALNKGVTVPGLGTFFAVKQDRPMAGVKLLDAKKPVFQVSEHFANVHGLPYKKETFPGIPPFVFLNYAWLSLDIGIPRDTVQRCIQETLLFLSYSLAKKQAVDFIFKDIGRLVFRKSRVQMHFSSDFVHNLNSNGQLLKCRLTDWALHTSWKSCREKSLSKHPRVLLWKRRETQRWRESLPEQMEKKLPHRGLRGAERIQLPAVPAFPRLAATLKQVPKAETSSSEKATCKLPPLQAAASATSARGRAKALGTEALSHRELLPPLPCVSAERERAVRAERWECVPHSPVAPAEDVEYSVRSFVSTVIRNAVAESKARLAPSGRGPRTTGHRTPTLPTAVPRHLKKSRHPAPHSPTDSFTALQDTALSVVSEAMSKAMAKMRQQGQRPAAMLSLGTESG